MQWLNSKADGVLISQFELNFTMPSTTDLYINGTEIAKDGIDWSYTILTTIMSSLSILGGLGIIIIYVCYKDMRIPGRRLLVYLSLTNAMTAFGNILGVVWLIYNDSYVINKSLVYCKIQSALSIYFSISSFSWTVVMGLCLVFSIVKSDPSFTSQFMCFFHIVCWILPGTCNLILSNWSKGKIKVFING